MKKIFLTVVAVFLSAFLLVSCSPFQVAADMLTDATNTINENNNSAGDDDISDNDIIEGYPDDDFTDEIFINEQIDPLNMYYTIYESPNDLPAEFTEDEDAAEYMKTNYSFDSQVFKLDDITVKNDSTSSYLQIIFNEEYEEDDYFIAEYGYQFDSAEEAAELLNQAQTSAGNMFSEETEFAKEVVEELAFSLPFWKIDENATVYKMNTPTRYLLLYRIDEWVYADFINVPKYLDEDDISDDIATDEPADEDDATQDYVDEVDPLHLSFGNYTKEDFDNDMYMLDYQIMDHLSIGYDVDLSVYVSDQFNIDADAEYADVSVIFNDSVETDNFVIAEYGLTFADENEAQEYVDESMLLAQALYGDEIEEPGPLLGVIETEFPYFMVGDDIHVYDTGDNQKFVILDSAGIYTYTSIIDFSVISDK